MPARTERRGQIVSYMWRFSSFQDRKFTDNRPVFQQRRYKTRVIIRARRVTMAPGRNIIYKIGGIDKTGFHQWNAIFSNYCYFCINRSC